MIADQAQPYRKPPRISVCIDIHLFGMQISVVKTHRIESKNAALHRISLMPNLLCTVYSDHLGLWSLQQLLVPPRAARSLVVPTGHSSTRAHGDLFYHLH
jgi:hypothetical protein